MGVTHPLNRVVRPSLNCHTIVKLVSVLNKNTQTYKHELFFQKAREQTKGRGWYNMPIGELTEEKKNDLIALKMRRALDPKRFYKGDDIKGLPKYFQVLS